MIDLPPLALPAGLVGTLAIVAFGLAILAAVLAPLVARSRRYEGPAGFLALVPFAVLTTAAVLAAASAALGTISRHGMGVREIATAALALICLTPVVSAGYVRLRYGPTGNRTFQQQMAGNAVSSMMLIAILFEILVVTGFLIGVGVGLLLDMPLLVGLAFAGISVLATAGATVFALDKGDSFILDISKARKADASGGREAMLRNVVAELSVAANLPAPAVYIIDAKAPNAFAVGKDSRHASIAVTAGLLELLDREELQGVIAHELAHIANLDSRHGLVVALLVGAVVVLTDVFFAAVLEIATNPHIGGDSISEMLAGLAIWIVVSILALIFAGTLKLFAPLAARAVQAAVSRDREYLADATSVGITRNPVGLASALRKLERDGTRLADANRGTQHLWIVNPVREANEGGRGWFDTHPSTQDRIARLRALAGQDASREDPRPDEPQTAPA
ncbi:MAG TPA: M48 family metalloprotease [Candidatus Limnocylindrales bacterium]|nr:M48 family metalloprotease [Candidatus Limnocylindrales bacterium]